MKEFFDKLQAKYKALDSVKRGRVRMLLIFAGLVLFFGALSLIFN